MVYLMHTGSVKDFYVTKEPSDTALGEGYLDFKLRPDNTGPVSIFDLKERFPFGITGKAEAMHDETVAFFELMRKNDVPTHYIEDLGSCRVAVYVAHIPQKDGWEQWVKTRGKKPFLVPIEVVITNTLTPVASAHKRLRKGAEKPEKYGLSGVPGMYETIHLPEPVITTSTKLGEHDVYRDDLFDVVGLTHEKRKELENLARQANEISTNYASQVGLDLADGKFEFFMDTDGKIYICDTFLTSDENRILAKARDGSWVDISKQFLRNIYTITGYREQLEAQQDAGVPFEQWVLPGPLDENTYDTVVNTYTVVQQELCKKPMGLDLTEVATRCRDTLDAYKEVFKRDETGAEI